MIGNTQRLHLRFWYEIWGNWDEIKSNFIWIDSLGFKLQTAASLASKGGRAVKNVKQIKNFSGFFKYFTSNQQSVSKLFYQRIFYLSSLVMYFNLSLIVLSRRIPVLFVKQWNLPRGSEDPNFIRIKTLFILSEIILSRLVVSF